LYSSSDEKHKIVATALSGFHAWSLANAAASKNGSTAAGSNTLMMQLNAWQEMCRSVGADMKDPYLRAMFAFISSGGKLQSILEEADLPLLERLGIALRFLPDDELVTYLQQMVSTAVTEGRLDSLVLTGFNFQSPYSAAVLIQNYVDRTSDIQTAALLMSHAPLFCFRERNDASELQAVRRLDDWVESYRSLLDRWQMYSQRCRFDIDRRQYANTHAKGGSTANSPFPANRLTSSPIISPRVTSEAVAIEEILSRSLSIQPQVYVRCNFCNQSIAHNSMIIPGVGLVGMSSKDNRKVMFESDLAKYVSTPGMIASNASGYSTPSIMNMSTASTYRAKQMACPSCRKPLPRCAICLLHMGMPLTSNRSESYSALDTAFTWCQTCRHGGHAIHIMQWFSRNDQCPVSECECRCNDV
jgi:hypothetical protein